jgi:hypothetical protein
MTALDASDPKLIDTVTVWPGQNTVKLRIGSAEYELTRSAAIALYNALEPLGKKTKRSIRWTEELKADLRRMYVDENKPVYDIAEAFGTTPEAIRANITRFKVPARNQNISRALHLRLAGKQGEEK